MIGVISRNSHCYICKQIFIFTYTLFVLLHHRCFKYLTLFGKSHLSNDAISYLTSAESSYAGSRVFVTSFNLSCIRVSPPKTILIKYILVSSSMAMANVVSRPPLMNKDQNRQISRDEEPTWQLQQVRHPQICFGLLMGVEDHVHADQGPCSRHQKQSQRRWCGGTVQTNRPCCWQQERSTPSPDTWF